MCVVQKYFSLLTQLCSTIQISLGMQCANVFVLEKGAANLYAPFDSTAAAVVVDRGSEWGGGGGESNKRIKLIQSNGIERERIDSECRLR